MRITALMNNRIPSVFNNSGFTTARSAMPIVSPRHNPAAEKYTPSIIVKISPEARAFYANISLISRFRTEQSAQSSLSQNLLNVQEASSASDIREFTGCDTCAERRYVDQSADGSVSMQTPTRLSPEEAASAVRAHEGEHIANERDRAEQDGRRVLSQSVVIHMDICEECGKAYIAGGEARTSTAPKNQQTALRAYELMQNMADTMLNA